MRRFALAWVLLALSCGGSSTPNELADPDVAPAAESPAGVPYPTAGIGTSIGQIVPNLAMRGYRDSNVAAGLTTISLADYYDPKGADHVLLYVAVAATWCSTCAEESRLLTSILPQYRPKGVVVLQALVAGPTSGYGPSLDEMQGWIGTYHTTWTVAADVRGRRFLGQIGFGGVPSSMLVDTRTMKILHASAGAPNDLAKYLQVGLDWIAAHPTP